MGCTEALTRLTDCQRTRDVKPYNSGMWARTWRVAVKAGIAAVVTAVVSTMAWGLGVFDLLIELGESVFGVHFGDKNTLRGWLSFGLMFLPFYLLSAVVYAVCGVMIKPRRDTTETRCRKCGYILKGLSRPECPECGEGI